LENFSSNNLWIVRLS